MPPQFSIHVDQDDLAKQDLAAGLNRPGGLDTGAGDRPSTGLAAHHGARDARQAARGRSERDHARAGARGKSRSYAFRRS
ncbi:hypothetical protein ACQP2F_29065 [Actinoplanes sp. CA-030573]|uniref:hypothetical protein n=1 Tax=Actinoplanes sp. CA-030573 TaxID=3239898 RepID=UPI003D93F34B